MSTIIESLGEHLLKVVEYELLKAEPEIQKCMVDELKHLLAKIDFWINLIPKTS